jgi:aminoglycoside phosphotransferase
VIDDALRADLADRLARAHDFELVSAEPLQGASVSTNRLLRLRAGDGREAVAKIYYRDGRGRLEREFGALARLESDGVARVPRPLLRCDEHQYAVYSLAPGAALPAAAYTTAHAADLASFAADLHRLRRLADDPLPVARGALVGLVDRASGAVGDYLAPYRALRASAEAPPALLALDAELDPAAEIERLLAAALVDAGGVWRGEPEPADLRFTNGDAGPHNVLAQPDGRVTVVDFEHSGWDHPLAFVTDFLTHDQSLDLPPAAAEAFLNTYRAAAAVPEHVWPELNRARAVRHIFWCAIHLIAWTPALVARRRFRDATFDADAYLTGQIVKLRRRLAIAHAAVAGLG